MSDSERTVRLVREVQVRVDGEHCSRWCSELFCHGLWGRRRDRYGCRLRGGDGHTFHDLRTERLSPYRPIRCKACVEGEVK